MRLQHFIPFTLLTAGAVLFLSCKKELSCENCGEVNRQPVANAGPDQLIVLPKDSILLDGSASSDPDGEIAQWLWARIEGPNSFILDSSTSAKTIVRNLTTGTYRFELTVTDKGGLSAKDTVAITVDALPTTNHPPIAKAGADTTIELPYTTATLDGSGSFDPDNNITGYQWTRATGPASCNIADANAVQTSVTGLEKGVYQFELKVTDAAGLFSKDTMQVTVIGVAATSCGSGRPEFTLTMTPVATGKLSKPRATQAIGAPGGKILFAGGIYTDASGVRSWGERRVDIYDMTTNAWSTAELSVARYQMTTIAAGNKIFFAGGTSGEIGDVTERSHAAVDIYDLSTNTWTQTIMSEAKKGMAAGTVGNKVFFAGGVGILTIGNSTHYGHLKSTVEIYDLSSGSWSVSTLGKAKTEISAVTLNDKIYFAGGSSESSLSSKIDIYDNATGSWSVSSLSEPKVVWGIGAGNKIYYTGGRNGRRELCTVEIKAVAAQTTSFDSLSDAGPCYPFLKDNKLICPRRNGRFDIYDLNTNTWSVAVLPTGTPLGTLIFLNNTVYIVEDETDANENVIAVIINKLNF